MNEWKIPEDLDEACINLCVAINKLPGVSTTGSCSGHGHSHYRIGLDMDLNSLGAITLARCTCPRYYNFFPGEMKINPVFRIEIRHTDIYPITFDLKGHIMNKDYVLWAPAERLAHVINLHIKEDFRIAKSYLKKMKDSKK